MSPGVPPESAPGLRRLLRGAAAPAILSIALAATPAGASSPIVWTHPPRGEAVAAEQRRDVRELPFRDEDSVRGVASGAGGSLTLSWALRELFPAATKLTPPPILWSAGLGGDGTLFVGTGNAGEVLRIEPRGTASVTFDAGEIGVRAVAVGSAGDLFVATFPAGAIYRIDSKGEAEPYFEPEDRYLWSLVAGPAGDLFVSTGERGIVYQVTGPSRSSVVFDSDEAHVTSLALEPSGTILAGTDPEGLVYRIAPEGRAEVVIDTDLREVPSLAVTPEGTVYAAAISEEPFQPAPRPGGRGDLTIEVTPAPDGGVLEEADDLPRKITIDLAELLPAAPSGVEGTAGRLYRIDPGRPAALVWKSDTERVLALAYSAQRGVVFGTGGGPEGRLYRLEPDGSTSLLHRFREPQVTGLAAGGDGRVYVCTSNPGRVYLLDPAPVASGTYSSSVFDAGRGARWGAISWDADAPAGTRIELSTRSGNRPNPDETWSPWSPPYADPRGSPVGSPSSRYLQWKAELSRIKTDAAPVLRRVSVALLQQNRRPTVSRVKVLDPGEVWTETGPVTATAAKPPGSPGAEPTREPPPPRAPAPGSRWVGWGSSDPDGDTVEHTLWLRQTGGAEFREVASGVGEPPYALDTSALTEGRWLLKVQASDGRVNGADAALGDAALSDGFLVDRTPPRLEPQPPEGGAPRGGRLSLQLRAADGVGTIARGAYCLGDPADDACWKDLPCRDRICDSAEEAFLLDLPAPDPGGRLAVRVQDSAGNRTSIDVPLASKQGGR